MSMYEKLGPSTTYCVTKLRSARLIVWALSLVIGLVLLSARPALSRWEIAQTTEPPAPSGHGSSPSQTAAPTPTLEAEPQDGNSAPIPLPDQARVPILMYHYVSELPPYPDRYRRDLTVSPESFVVQLQYLADAGYHPVTLTDLHLHFTQGYPLPDRPIVLTFDDGYRDAYDVVFPLLLDHGFTATFFVLASPAHTESPDYLTWAQMKEMADAGMEIQAHGRDHVDLRGRSYDYLVYQILGIQEAIHYHTGRLPRFFCYPSGQYDANVIAVLESAGYWGAVTTQWGVNHSPYNMYEMPRVRVRGKDTLVSFVDKID